MVAAKIIDSIWATRKTDLLKGLKLMMVEIIGGTETGKVLIVVDTIGAGIGERVLVVYGSSARRMIGNDDVPIDGAIVGIIDEDCQFKA